MPAAARAAERVVEAVEVTLERSVERLKYLTRSDRRRQKQAVADAGAT
jgi:hypothetical protein